MNISIGTVVYPRKQIVGDWAAAGIAVVRVTDMAGKIVRVSILSVHGDVRYENWSLPHVQSSVDQGFYELHDPELPDGIVLDDGKYEFYYDSTLHELTCKRYGQPWRSFVGDKAVKSLYDYACMLVEDRNALLRRMKP